MRVALTGTPGTGKTTVSDRLDTHLDVVHLNDVVRDAGLYTERDAERDSLVVDLDAVDERYAERADVLIESHLAHHLDDLDAVVVLRCAPTELEARFRERSDAPEQGDGPDGDAVARENSGSAEPPRALTREARENSGSAEPPRALTREARENSGSAEMPRALAREAQENAEAEALDVILAEAVEAHGVERVYEVDTTDRTPDAVAADVDAAIRGERDPSAGDVDFTGYLL